MNKAIAFLTLTLLSANVAASIMFITPSDVTSLNSAPQAQYNNVNALIDNATDTSYVAPNPSGGGGGTSTWTNLDNNTWTFSFDTPYTLNTAYIWDYYTHSPTDWSFNFFDDVNAGGTNLGIHSFSIAPVAAPGSSALHTVSFADFNNVRSVTLSNVNQSAWGGVGLAEVHFGGAAATSVPEPSTLAILGLGLMALGAGRLKKR